MLKPSLAVLSVLALLVILATAFVLRIDVDQYKGEIVQLIEARSGRRFAIDGDIHFVPALVPTIAVERLRLGNPAWATSDMLKINRIDARIALRPLLSRRIEVKRLVISGIAAALATNAQGEHNWRIDSGLPSSFALATFAVDEVKINDLMVHYSATKRAIDVTVKSLEARSATDEGVTALTEITAKEAAIAYQSGTRSVTLALHSLGLTSDETTTPVQVKLVGRYDTIPMNLRGVLGTWAQLLDRARTPFAIHGNVGGVKVQTTGEVDPRAKLGALTSTLALEAETLAIVGNMFGMELPR
ncbi:MAG: AsmA family protein [Gammaproteobacteria bacterium]|nr:AsmA family protein [Gammaproteobacteria bacterium]